MITPRRLALCAIIAVPIVASIEINSYLTTDTVNWFQLRIIDGDTVALGKEHIRISNIDAPEIGTHAHCDAERAAGDRAKADLDKIIYLHNVTIRREYQHDRYGRTLAVLIVDNADVGDILMRDGVALPYKSGFYAHRERTAHWCGPGNW